MPAVSGAALLRHLIEARTATLSDVAKGTGVALSTLSSVFEGTRRLNLGHITALASYFGVEAAVFLDGVGSCPIDPCRFSATPTPHRKRRLAVDDAPDVLYAGCGGRLPAPCEGGVPWENRMD